MTIHISACQLQIKKDDQHIAAVAILTEPGVSDVITFIAPDGKPLAGNNVWDYFLTPYRGAISI